MPGFAIIPAAKVRLYFEKGDALVSREKETRRKFESFIMKQTAELNKSSNDDVPQIIPQITSQEFFDGHVAVLSSAFYAYTKKRGAGVKSFPVNGDKNKISPMQICFAHLNNLLQRACPNNTLDNSNIRLSILKNSIDLCESTENSKRHLTIKPGICFILSQLERLIGNIGRILDDRSSMLRRGGDDIGSAPLTTSGVAVLLQEIWDAVRVMTSVHDAIISTPILSSFLQTIKGGTGGIYSDPSNGNRFSSQSDFYSTGCDEKGAQDTLLLNILCRIKRRIRFWIGPSSISSTNFVACASFDWDCSVGCGTQSIAQRVEGGLAVSIGKIIDVLCSNCLKKNSFLMSRAASLAATKRSDDGYRKRGCWRRLGFGSLGTGPESADLMREICNNLLSPVLESIKICPVSSTCMYRVLTVVINAALDSVLFAILRRHIPFNEVGVAALHAQLSQLITWVKQTKRSLDIPPAVPLVQNIRPWLRADAVLQELLSACSGSPTHTPKQSDRRARQRRAANSRVTSGVLLSYRSALANATLVNKSLKKRTAISNDDITGRGRMSGANGHGRRSRSNTSTGYGAGFEREDLGRHGTPQISMPLLTVAERDLWASLAVRAGVGNTSKLGQLVACVPLLSRIMGHHNGNGAVFIALKLDASQL